MRISGRLIDTVKVGLPAYTYFYTVGSVGFWIPLYAKDLGWSYTVITLLATLYFIFITPSNIISGIITDALGNPSRILALGMIGNALTTLLMPYTRTPGELMLLRALQGMSLATSLPLAIGSLSLMHGVARGVGIAVVFQGMGMASGSIAGGMIISRLGYAALFHTATLLSLASAILAYTWRYDYRPAGGNILGSLRRIPIGVVIMIVAMIARNTFASGVFSILSIVFSRSRGLTLGETGLALALNPVMQVLTAIIAPRIVRGREVYAYSAGLAVSGLVFYIYSIASTSIHIYMAQALLGASFAVTATSGNIYMISNSPREIRYTASSLFTFSFNMGWVIGTLIAGPVMDHYSPETWINISIYGSIASGLIALSTLAYDNK